MLETQRRARPRRNASGTNNFGCGDLTQLVSKHKGFVARVAGNYSQCGVPREDLIQEGIVGLLKAARRFDPCRGTRFLTYAAPWVRKQILLAVERQSRIVPLSDYRMARLRRMRKAEQLLSQHLGRAPSRDELGRHMHSCRKELDRLRLCCSIDLPIEHELESGELLLLPLQDPSMCTPEQEVLRSETSRLVSEALQRLSVHERIVVSERYGLADGRMRTLREVATGLGVSRERVRQIESSARLKIARYLFHG